MKKALLLVPLLILAGAAATDGAENRTLNHSVPVGSIEKLVLDSGIGDVEIQGVGNTSEVTIEVVLTPRRGGFFSSKRRAAQDVESASLSTEVRGDRLTLHIAPKADDERRFEESWSILVPDTIAVEVDHGVGDIDIRGIDGGVGIDSGVGEIRVEAEAGDIMIDLGVGTAVVRAPAAAFASAEGAGGVGDARLTVRGKKISSGGFVSHSATWEGDGRFHIEVSVGVGDAVITLD